MHFEIVSNGVGVRKKVLEDTSLEMYLDIIFWFIEESYDTELLMHTRFDLKFLVLLLRGFTCYNITLPNSRVAGVI